MIRSILKISLFIPLLFSCQNDKKDVINNFSVDKNSFLINIVKIVDTLYWLIIQSSFSSVLRIIY
jgi:hypothetical protein